jgi:hypothetical protein
MKRINFFMIIILIFLIGGAESAYGQGRILRRLKDEAEKKAVEDIFKDKNDQQTPQNDQPGSDRSGRHRGGGGLSQKAPDVNQSIADASKSHSGGDYRTCKSSIKDAIWGIELEMGQNVLKSLPPQIHKLQVQAGSDRVSSTGMGFTGMLIERVYSDDDEVEFVVSIGNDAAILGISAFMMAGDYYRDSNEEVNQKQIRFQEHRAIIAFDEYSGYSLTAPFGQSSILVLKGVNFQSEDEFMAAADVIDLKLIKQNLGEQ